LVFEKIVDTQKKLKTKLDWLILNIKSVKVIQCMEWFGLKTRNCKKVFQLKKKNYKNDSIRVELKVEKLIDKI